jgi:hypothetical protein
LLRVNVGTACRTIISRNKATSSLSCMNLDCVQISCITLEAYIEHDLVGVDIVKQLKIEVTFTLPCCWFSLTNEKWIRKRWIQI